MSERVEVHLDEKQFEDLTECITTIWNELVRIRQGVESIRAEQISTRRTLGSLRGESTQI